MKVLLIFNIIVIFSLLLSINCIPIKEISKPKITSNFCYDCIRFNVAPQRMIGDTVLLYLNVEVKSDSLRLCYNSKYTGYIVNESIKNDKNIILLFLTKEDFKLTLFNYSRVNHIIFPIAYVWFDIYRLVDSALYIYNMSDYFPEGYDIFVEMDEDKTNPLYFTLLKPNEEIFFKGKRYRHLHLTSSTYSFELGVSFYHMFVNVGPFVPLYLLKLVNIYNTVNNVNSIDTCYNDSSYISCGYVNNIILMYQYTVGKPDTENVRRQTFILRVTDDRVPNVMPFSKAYVAKESAKLRVELILKLKY